MEELKLPKSILDKAIKSGNEFGWRSTDVLEVIDAAKQMPMAIIGGQIQYIWPDATCELYWLSYDSEARKENEEWKTYCERTAIECSEKIKSLLNTDIEQEAIKTSEFIKKKLDEEDQLNEHQIFILYFSDKEKA